MIPRNTANVPILLPTLMATDGTAVTANAVIAVRKDGVPVDTPAGSLVHTGLGVWEYTPAQAETDAGMVGLILSAAGAVAVPMNVVTTRLPVQTAGVLPDVQAGTSGGLPTRDANGVTLAANQAVAPVTIAAGQTVATVTNPVTLAAGQVVAPVTIAANQTVANVTTVATVTNPVTLTSAYDPAKQAAPASAIPQNFASVAISAGGVFSAGSLANAPTGSGGSGGNPTSLANAVVYGSVTMAKLARVILTGVVGEMVGGPNDSLDAMDPVSGTRVYTVAANSAGGRHVSNLNLGA